MSSTINPQSLRDSPIGAYGHHFVLTGIYAASTFS